MNHARPQQGFVLGAVLVLSGLAALLVLDALTGAALAQASVTRLRLRHAAFEAAEGALGAVTERVAADTGAALHSNGSRADVSVRASARLTALEPAPVGFSAGRFRLQHFDLEASAAAPRGTELVLQVGLSRWSIGP